MYEKAEGTPNKNYPNPPTYTDAQPPQPAVGQHTFSWPWPGKGSTEQWSGKGTFQADPAETDEAIIFVHGWNMDDPDRRTYANSFFKRLWWKGFRGRFCAFSWPTYNVKNNSVIGLVPAHYNQSEYVAWKYGPALKQYVDSIQKTSKNVAAHSMGNVVMASALKAGLMVNSYVAMEAAIPAGCYDASDAANNYDMFNKAEAKTPTTSSGNPAPVYRGFMAGVPIPEGKFHNFYNTVDFALKTGKKTVPGGIKLLDTNWEANQVNHKPNTLLRYKYYPELTGAAKNCVETMVYTIIPAKYQRKVTDQHEVLSFISRPRSEALGCVDTTGFKGFDLHGAEVHYPFSGLQTEHSGQFERPIQRTHFFYNEMLKRMEVQFNNVREGDL